MINTKLSPLDQMSGLLRTENKTLNDSQYKFHSNLHEILSTAFTTYNLHVLSKEQEALVINYIAAAENISDGSCTDQELIQLDQYLGSLTNELYN